MRTYPKIQLNGAAQLRKYDYQQEKFVRIPKEIEDFWVIFKRLYNLNDACYRTLGFLLGLQRSGSVSSPVYISNLELFSDYLGMSRNSLDKYLKLLEGSGLIARHYRKGLLNAKVRYYTFPLYRICLQLADWRDKFTKEVYEETKLLVDYEPLDLKGEDGENPPYLTYWTLPIEYRMKVIDKIEKEITGESF